MGGQLYPYPQKYHQPVYHQQPAHQDQQAQILRLSSNVDPNGAYDYSFETANGIQTHESGVGGQSAQGSVHYTAPDGTPIELTYTADENGFHPVGAHLPTPPPIPEAILRSLAYNEAHPQPQEELLRYNQQVPVSKPNYYALPKQQPSLLRQQPAFKPTFKPLYNNNQYQFNNRKY